MADYFGLTPAGAIPYGAEYLQAANRYGVQPTRYDAAMQRYLSAHNLPHTNRPNPKPKARARDAPASHQDSAQARNDENNDIGDGLEENCFALVSTAELEQQGLKKHPDKIAEAASLNSVSLPAGKYKLGLPPFIIQGRISALQYQSVRLACQRHETFLPDRTRAGFFLGDGPGVGKGRQIASVIFENLLRGRKKAVWFSATGDLAQDARRDFRDIGALAFDIVRLHDLKHCKIKASGKLADAKDFDCGVLFSTYDLLISGKKVDVKSSGLAKQVGEVAEEVGSGDLLAGPPEDKSLEAQAGLLEFADGSRLSQIVEWLGGEQFDGALVFDECHKAKNCIAKQGDKGRRQSESKTSRAAVEIQRRLPNARVLYVSATGATEAENLCYMTRLGLWGEQTAFPNKQEFVNMLQTQGVAAMELVAMELKQSGSFIARTLSYEGVEFEQQHVNITDEYKSMYDKAAEVWLQLKETIEHCKEELHILDKRVQKSILGQFYSGQLRFFRQLCTAAKVETVSQLALKTLEEGEARTEAMVASAQKDDGFDGSFDAFAEPANLILATVIKMLPADFSGRAELLRKADALKLPGNPLDELIERLGGPDKVAEMSGRKKRMVKQPDGHYRYLSRAGPHTHLDGVNIAEKDAFQDGKKFVAVISDAASTGISLHADRSRKNTRQRVHVTLELAWSADKTVQQLGRSHRSNQLQPPKYVIVSTDICGEHRFASAVANRLQQLGALTHGDRRAASAADALSGFNLQNKFSQAALRKMYKVLLGNLEPPEDVTPHFIDEEMSFVGSVLQQQAERRRHFMEFIPDGKDALMEVGVLQADAKTELDQQMASQQQAPGGNINKLLNRLLGCQVDMQSKIFGYFSALQDAEIKLAKENGTYNESGIIKPRGESIAFKRKDVIYQDEYSGMCTYHAEFEIDRGMNYDAALRCIEEERVEDPDTQAGFFQTCHGNRTWHVLALPRDPQGRRLKRIKDRHGRLKKAKASYYRLVRPHTGFGVGDMGAEDFNLKYKLMKQGDTLKSVWNGEWKADRNKDQRHKALHLITGSILPILPTVDKLLRGRKVDGRMWQLQVMRVESTDGQRQEVGLYLSDSMAARVLRNIRDLQPLKPSQFAGGVNSVDINGRVPVPGEPLAPRQAPLPPPAAPSSAVVNLLDEEATEKENEARPKAKKATALRDPTEKRMRRKKAEAVADPEDMDEDVVAPEVMAAAGLWEDIELPARRQVVEEPAQKRKPARPPKQQEPEFCSEAETEDFQEGGKEHDSDADSPSSAAGTTGGNKSRARPQRASSKRAAKAIAGSVAAIDLNDDSDKNGSDNDGSDMNDDSDKENSGKKDKSASARQAGDSNGSDEEDETFASRAARRKGQLQKGSSRTAPKSRSSSPAQSDSSRGHAKDSGSHDSDADEESPAPAMLKSRKGQHKSAEIGIHTSRESSVALRSNSEISAGWTVRCKCGITDDDGAAMTECEGGCKTWVHIACFALEGDAAYWCDACKENVHTSKPTSTKPTANASSSNADSGESQSTPCAVGSLAGAANMDSKASDAAATAAAVATSKSPISSADDSNSTGSADGGKPAFAREDSRAVAAGLPLASAKLDESDEGIHLTAGSPPKSAALPRSDTGKSLAIRSGRIEKPRRRLITKRNEATASPDMSDEVIDLQDSSREATPEIASESKAAADKTSSLAGSSPLQPITSGAVPSRPAPRASSISPAPRASSGSPVPRAPSGSPAPRASPAASHRNSADDGSLNQSASQPTPLRPQRIPSLTDVAAPSSLDDTEKQTTPLRPPRPMRDLTSSIDNARDSVAVAGAQGIPSKGTPSKGTPSKATPSKRARTAAGDSDEAIVLTGEQGIPSKGTPSKVTPSKRARNIAADGGGSEECVLLAAGSTPGKRRKSLLPPTDKLIQEQHEASEITRLRSRCAALEAAAAKQQAERQLGSANMAVGDESSIRRSIEAEVNKKAKEEKLALIKRTLQVGKRAGKQEAEAQLKDQLQTLQGQTAAASSELQAANAAFQKERATWQQQQQTWQAQQAQHADILRQHQADNRAPMAEQKQQWEAERAQREAQAQLEFKRKRADERESWRRRWEAERAQREAQAELEFKHKQQQWEAERAAQAQHAQQLQAEMAAMKADLEQYKTALAAAQQDTGSALTSGGASGGMPLTPYTPGHPPGGVNPGACKPDNGAASTPDPAQLAAAKTGADTASKRVSWAPLPSPKACSEPEVPASPVSKDAVLTWLEGREASMSEISDGLKAKQQQAALSNIMQELQDDFDVATKAGRYFLL